MKAAGPPRFSPSVRTGSFSATAAPAANRRLDVGARADRAIAGIRAAHGDVLIVSSAHILRVLAARWLGLDAACGRHLVLGTASLSLLGYEHNLLEPAIRLWNDTRHVDAGP